MVLGPAAEIAAVKRQVAAVKGRIIERPRWLRGTAASALVDISAHLEELQAEIVLAYAELDTLFDEYSLGQALGEVEQLVGSRATSAGWSARARASSGSPAGRTI